MRTICGMHCFFKHFCMYAGGVRCEVSELSLKACGRTLIPEHDQLESTLYSVLRKVFKVVYTRLLAD